MVLIRRLEKAVPARLRPYATVYVGIGLLVSVVSLVILGRIVDGVSENESLVAFDVAFANALHSVATAGSTSIFLDISLLGSQILFAWCVIVGLILAWRRQWLGLIMWAITIIGGEILNSVLKLVFARPRPVFATPLVIEQYYSFPSGHAMMSFIAYGMLAYLLCLLVKNGPSRLLIIILAAMLILLIGISRMALGVHYFSDVVGGYSVAAIWLVSCISTWRYIQQRRASHNPTK